MMDYYHKQNAEMAVYGPYNRSQYGHMSGQAFRRNMYIPPQDSSVVRESQQRAGVYREDDSENKSYKTTIAVGYNPQTQRVSYQTHQPSDQGPVVNIKDSTNIGTRTDSNHHQAPVRETQLNVEVDSPYASEEVTFEFEDFGDEDVHKRSSSNSSTGTRKTVEHFPEKEKELFQAVLAHEPGCSNRRKPLSGLFVKKNDASGDEKVPILSQAYVSEKRVASVEPWTGQTDYGSVLPISESPLQKPTSAIVMNPSSEKYSDKTKLIKAERQENIEVPWTFEPMSPQHQAANLEGTTSQVRSVSDNMHPTNGWMSDPNYILSDHESNLGCCGLLLMICSYLVIFLTLPVSLCLTIKVVQEYERAVIFRLGRLLPGGAKGPGLFFIIPCLDSYTKVDIRTVSFDVPPQEVLSKDSVTVAVDAVVYYRVHNATISVTNVEDFSRSTRLLAATTLRNVLGTKNLSEILSEREAISHLMQSTLDEATDPWGVKVERVEVKDVRLPVQLQRAMAAEAEAAREARAKVIAAEGEEKSSRALKDAADIINESPAALQLRYLQTLNTISAEKNSTIIFPLPMDFLKSFVK